MAKQYSITNLRTYEAAFQNIEKETKEFMTSVLKEAAKQCFLSILDRSPYKTGSYIASHRIGINSADGSDSVYKKSIGKSAAKGIAKTELLKLEGVKVADSIHISNSVGFSNANHYSWAANVEYTGWGSRGGYLVYNKALMETMNNFDKYVDYVKAKGEGVLGDII